MNAELLGKYFKEPALVNADGVKELEELCNNFPYFALPQLVLTKVYKLQDHYRYADALKTSALMSPSREWLYDFLEDELPGSDIEQEIHEEVIEEEIPQTASEEIIDEEQPVDQPDLETVEELAEEVSEPLSEETEIISEPEESVEEALQMIKEETIAVSPENEIGEEEPKEIKPKPETVSSYRIEDFFEWTESDDPKSFFDWLKKPGLSETKSTDLPAPGEEVSSKPADPMELIEKFLTERPSISRPKTEFFNPANVAKKGEELHPDLVTETLADLFYKQESYEKALFAYDILCLKIPEKRHYFAALIQKIKEEQIK